MADKHLNKGRKRGRPVMLTPDQRKEAACLRKQRQRARKSGGGTTIQVRVDDPEALQALLCEWGMSPSMSLAAALDAFLGDKCREYRRELLEAEWEKVTRIRVGSLDREPREKPLGDCLLIKKAPPREQDEVAEPELIAELFDKRPDDDYDYNYETGGAGRVNTKHDWKWDT